MGAALLTVYFGCLKTALCRTECGIVDGCGCNLSKWLWNGTDGFSQST